MSSSFPTSYYTYPSTNSCDGITYNSNTNLIAAFCQSTSSRLIMLYIHPQNGSLFDSLSWQSSLKSDVSQFSSLDPVTGDIYVTGYSYATGNKARGYFGKVYANRTLAWQETKLLAGYSECTAYNTDFSVSLQLMASIGDCYKPDADVYIQIYHPNGTEHSSYAFGSGVSDEGFAIAFIPSDNYQLIAAGATNSVAFYAGLRLNQTRSAFQTIANLNGEINSVKVVGDRFYLGGGLTGTFNARTSVAMDMFIGRFFFNLTRDTTFAIFTGAANDQSVYGMHIDPISQKVVVAGYQLGSGFTAMYYYSFLNGTASNLTVAGVSGSMRKDVVQIGQNAYIVGDSTNGDLLVISNIYSATTSVTTQTVQTSIVTTTILSSSIQVTSTYQSSLAQTSTIITPQSSTTLQVITPSTPTQTSTNYLSTEETSSTSHITTITQIGISSSISSAPATISQTTTTDMPTNVQTSVNTVLTSSSLISADSSSTTSIGTSTFLYLSEPQTSTIEASVSSPSTVAGSLTSTSTLISTQTQASEILSPSTSFTISSSAIASQTYSTIQTSGNSLQNPDVSSASSVPTLVNSGDQSFTYISNLIQNPTSEHASSTQQNFSTEENASSLFSQQQSGSNINIGNSGVEGTFSQVTFQFTASILTGSQNTNSFNQNSASQALQDLQGNQSVAFVDGQLVTILISAVAAAIFTLLAAFFVIRKRSARNTKSTTLELDSTTTFNNNSFISVDLNTQVTTETAIAIPAFLQIKYGVDFREDKLIAQGGTAKVFLGEVLSYSLKQRVGNNLVIAKKSNTSTDQMLKPLQDSFYQEVSLLWKLRNGPNICQIYGYSEDPATLLLKYYQLGSLTGFVLSNFKLPDYSYNLIQVLNILKQVSRSLQYLHDNQIAHCDIKLDNILLDVDQTGKLVPILTDFGISRILDANNLQVKAFQVSQIKGASLSYASPEALRQLLQRMPIENPLVYKQSDTYSYSIVLFEMLTRKYAWL